MEIIHVIPVQRYEHREKQSETHEHQTAKLHGCRPLNCTSHWETIKLPAANVRVRVAIDVNALAQAIATRAAHNRSGKAIGHNGRIVAKIVR